MLLLAVRRLTKEIILLNKEISLYFKDALEKLKPLINALNKATPFLEIFNAITGLFRKGKKKK